MTPIELPEQAVVFISLHKNDVVNMIEDLQGSCFSHCGILKNGKVIHTGFTCEEIPFERFRELGRGGFCAFYTSGKDAAIWEAALRYRGQYYDEQYDSSDLETCYCSELVWRAMRDAGLPIPQPVAFNTLGGAPETLAFAKSYFYAVDERPVVTPKMLLPFLKLVKSYYPPIASFNRNGYASSLPGSPICVE